ncbi:MAG: aromatic ring-hydroxylating dioxygenase subunit alpha [Proteobacteria bacterium]|nr:aromatic ring-hydroxylating dioxygenase subunit alpha [Pseudomonadota bacterium]
METTRSVTYLKNAWYVAALSSEVGAEDLFARKLLNTPVLIYRTQGGSPVALLDRCPHRFVPLSMGVRSGDDVVCKYHGLKFDCSGACNRNPHGNGHIPRAARVRTFPLSERYGFIWIWMGDEPADESKLPDVGPLTEGHPNGVGYTYMHRKTYYELITDNVMDLSHVDHLHGEIISTRGQLTPQVPQIRETNSTVSTRWEWKQTPPIFILNQFLPEPMAEARHFVEVIFMAPSTVQLQIGATQDDGALDLEHCVGQYDLHTTTPETDGTTHYFFATRRNHLVEDAEYNAAKVKGMHDAFVDEDGPYVDAQYVAIGNADLMSLNPVLLTSDVGAVRARRILRSVIADEVASLEGRASSSQALEHA